MRSSGLTLLIQLGILFIVSSCSRDSDKYRDVSGISIHPVVKRFDQELMKIETVEHTEKLLSTYSPFAQIYIDRQLTLGSDTLSSDLSKIVAFQEDEYVLFIQEKINLEFPDDKKIKDAAEQPLRYVKYYWPNVPTPAITTANSLLNPDYVNCLMLDSNNLILFLDQFLGRDFAGYDSAGYYQYMRSRMTPEYISRSLLTGIFNTYWGESELNPEHNLVEAMIEHGKRYYFLEYMMPDAHDSIIAGFTGAQWQWCKLSEKQIWQFFNDKDLLYKTNFMEQKRYLQDGPSSPNMPSESPGNTGSWVGWQIVRSFMKNKKNEITLQELLKLEPKSIFKQSQYKPS